MADEPVAMVTVNLPAESGDGGGVPMPDLRPLLGSMSATLETISKNVSALLASATAIAEQLGRMAVRMTSQYSVRRPYGTQRAVFDVSGNPLTAPPPKPGLRGAGVSGPPIPKPTAIGRGIAGAVGLADPAARHFTMGVTSLAGLGAVGVPLGIGIAGVGAMRLAWSAGDSTMRRLATFSPTIAGFQAQVDMNKWVRNYEIANSPGMTKLAQINAQAAIAADNALSPVWMLWDKAKLAASTFAYYGFLTSAGGITLWNIARKLGFTGGNNATGPMAQNTFDQMVGGLLSMQERPLPGAKGRYQPTTVRWNRGGWERSPTR